MVEEAFETRFPLTVAFTAVTLLADSVSLEVTAAVNVAGPPTLRVFAVVTPLIVALEFATMAPTMLTMFIFTTFVEFSIPDRFTTEFELIVLETVKTPLTEVVNKSDTALLKKFPSTLATPEMVALFAIVVAPRMFVVNKSDTALLKKFPSTLATPEMVALFAIVVAPRMFVVNKSDTALLKKFP